METNDEEVDTADLQLYTVMNRENYTFHIKRLLTKCSKYRIKSLEKENTNQMQDDESRLRELDLSIKHVKHVELGILNKKSDTDLKNALKDQIRMMAILNKKKNCPISKKMDEL